MADSQTGEREQDFYDGGEHRDRAADVGRYISAEVRELYDVYSYGHAAAILATGFPEELKEVEKALLAFRISTREIGLPGGNESDIPKKISRVLRPLGWAETRIKANLQVTVQQCVETFQADGKSKKEWREERALHAIENFIDGHKIDYVKGRVAFDLEWNSKDQTFDRDLYAFRAFHECGIISAGVVVTRSESLNYVFKRVPKLDKAGEPVIQTAGKLIGRPQTVQGKYGASTTWMGKLIARLNAGRQGRCPVLVFGITPALISDWTRANPNWAVDIDMTELIGETLGANNEE